MEVWVVYIKGVGVVAVFSEEHLAMQYAERFDNPSVEAWTVDSEKWAIKQEG